MPELDVTAWDIATVVGYVFATRLLFGWYAARKAKGGAEGYFLGGRNLRWPLIGLSFYVANMSGGSFVGLPGSGYHQGIAVYHYEWLPALILALFVLFLLPLYLRARVFTAPEYLGRRFGRKPRLAFSGFLLVTSTLIDAPASLYSGAMVVEALFPELPIWITIATASLVAGLYIAFGGLRAVVLNDVLQALMILVGGTTVAVLAWLKLPSWRAVVESAPPGALRLMQPASDPFVPWPGILTGILIIGIYYWCTNQFVIQRALAARDLDHGRWGALFAGLLKLPNLFILILPGTMATALYPGLDNPDLVFPTLVFDLLPAGARGLLLAALVAAILSSLEAILNSAATLLTMDFVCTLRPQTRDRQLAWIGRLATLGFMVLAALWTPLVTTFPTLWQYLQSFMAYITPPVTAVFVLGMFWPRATANAAFVTLATGVPLGVAGWIANELFALVPIQHLYACGLLFVFHGLLMASVSLFGAPPPRARIAPQVWSAALWREDSAHQAQLPRYQRFRYQALGLMALASGIIAWWW